jgi:hypothetical protein
MYFCKDEGRISWWGLEGTFWFPINRQAAFVILFAYLRHRNLAPHHQQAHAVYAVSGLEILVYGIRLHRAEGRPRIHPQPASPQDDYNQTGLADK